MTNSAYTLGIDPAKQKFTVCLLDPDGGEIIAPTDVNYTRQGFDQMLGQLRGYVAAGNCLVVGIECSAALDDNLLALFASMREEFKLTLIRVEAQQVKRFSGSRPVRGKTDKADARRIARFTRTYTDELARFVCDPELLALQRLVNERLTLAEDLTADKNRLQDRLVISFPELTQVFDDPCCDTALALLVAAPTAAHVAGKRVASLAAIRPAKPHGHRIGAERAQKLRQLAASSIASAVSDDDAATIQRLVARIELLNDQIAQIEHRLEEFAAAADQQQSEQSQIQELGHQPTGHLPSPARQIQIARSFKGIGLVSASAIVLRSQGLTRFSSGKALSAQLAACPDRNQTGSSTNSAALTYRGDRRGRVLCYLAIMACCRADIAMAFHYWRLIQSGKMPKQAYCACMNRMLRILWHLVQTNTLYDPERAIANARKHHPQQWKSFLSNQEELGKTIRKKLKNTPMECLI